jgi:hypothetical protein
MLNGVMDVAYQKGTHVNVVASDTTYEAPQVLVLGTVAELTLTHTHTTPPGKNPGSSDADSTADGPNFSHP